MTTCSLFKTWTASPHVHVRLLHTFFVVMRTFRPFYSSVTFRAKIPVERDIFILAVQIKKIKVANLSLNILLMKKSNLSFFIFYDFLRYCSTKSHSRWWVTEWWFFYRRNDCRLWEYVGQRLSLAEVNILVVGKVSTRESVP